jgi:acyl-CoA thioesterase I
MKNSFVIILFSMSSLLLSSCWVSETSNQAGSVSPPKLGEVRTILALGDSLTAGYQLPPEESYTAQLEELLKEGKYQYRVQNAGVSGDTTAQLLARLDWTLGDTASPPALAIVEIGANDAFQGVDPELTRANIRSIIERIQSRNIPVLLAGMKAPLNLGSLYRNKFESIYSDLEQELKVPRMEFFLEGVAAEPSLNLSDGIHPNRAGYAIIAANVLAEFKKYSLIQK